MARKKRVAILISGRGSNMVALIEAAKDNGLSRRDRAGRLQRTHGRKVSNARAPPASRPPWSIIGPYGKDREAFERALQAAIEPHAIDLICLAGFMRLLTPWFIGAMARADAQHPSGAAARLQGPRHPRPRDRRRRQAARRDGAFRRAGNGFRPDHRAGGRAGACPTTPRRRSPRACSRSSTGSIRWRCGWSRKAG